MPNPKETERTEQALSALFARPARMAETCADRLVCFMAYCSLTQRAGNTALNLSRCGGLPALAAAFGEALPTGGAEAEEQAAPLVEAAFGCLNAVCSSWETENPVLGDALTAFLPYIPHDADLYRHLASLTGLLNTYLAEPPEQAPDFLLSCLNTALTDPESVAFDTPEGICRLFRALAESHIATLPAGYTVYDPCCGSGRLVAAMVQNGEKRVFGKDMLAAVRPFFLVRNLLAGNTGAAFSLGDSIASPLTAESEPAALQTFDLVVSQPPFGFCPNAVQHLAEDPFHRFDRGVPRRNSGDWLHICNMLAHAEKERGMVMVLGIKATLFRVDISAQLRRCLTEENLPDAVISLPQGVLAPYTGIAPALLIFRNGRRRRGIRFIQAASAGTKERRSTLLTEADIDRIRRAYESDETEPGFARTVDAAELAANEWTWEVSAYISPRGEAAAPAPSAEEMQAEIASLRTQLQEKQQRLAALLALFH